jgi:hypothetical protein
MQRAYPFRYHDNPAIRGPACGINLSLASGKRQRYREDVRVAFSRHSFGSM